MAERSRPDFSTLKPLKIFLPYLSRYKERVFFSALMLIGAAAVTLAIPLFISQVVDNGFSVEQSEHINGYFAGVFVCSLLLALFSAGRYYLVTSLGERVTADVRRDVFDHILTLSAPFFDTARSGEISSRLTADTTLIKSAAAVSVSIALRNGLLFVGAVIMMLVTSLALTGLVLLIIPLVVIPLVFFGQVVRKKTQSAQAALADSMAFASEMIGGVRTVQSYTGETFVSNRFSQGIEKSYEEARSSIQARAFLVAFAILIIFSSVTGILWYATTDVIAGNMSAGTLSQFIIYAVMASSGLGQLSEVWAEVSHAVGAAERLSELLDTQPEISSPPMGVKSNKKPSASIEFSEVSFSYPSAPQSTVLANLSLSIQPGEKVALVGPSGSGKSTLFQLLTRFYDTNNGHIRLGGEDVRNFDVGELRDQFASVAQDPLIFAATIEENIAFGKPGASRQEICDAAARANADEFISQTPNGYETLVGERGITLSGGQRQRIAIARAILRDAPILLLDEATSALDSENEAIVQNGLNMLMADRTTLIIAHRLATIRDVDRIYVLDNGRIVEAGTHDELTRKHGLYSKLASYQIETEAV